MMTSEQSRNTFANLHSTISVSSAGDALADRFAPAFPDNAEVPGGLRVTKLLPPGIIFFGNGSLPHAAADFGVWRASETLPRLAQAAMTVARLLNNYPQPLTKVGALQLYRAAW